MRPNRIAGIVCYVKDIVKTADFYEKLGFVIDTVSSDHLSARINEFWIDFLSQDKEEKVEFQKEAKLENKGAGQFIYLNVDNVDEYYEYIKERGLNPKYDPRDWPWGNREFMLRDPDGYKLVFFQRFINNSNGSE
jgi:catechol 2,3-dioxygenase-like lactoylglutathione lyase family enzyme